MKIASKIAANTVFLIGHQSLSKASGFLFLIFATRFLDPSGFGKFSFALAFTAFFYFLANLGLHGVEIREEARDHQEIPRFLFHSLVLRTALSVLAFILLTTLSLAMDLSAEMQLVVIALGLAICIDSVTGAFHSTLLATEKMNQAGAVIHGISTVRNILGIAVLYWGMKLTDLSLLWPLTSLVFLAIAAKVVFSRYKVRRELDFSFIKWLLKETWPFALSALVITGYFRADVLILTWFRNVQEVGWYSAAYRIWDALLYIPLAFLGAVFPTLSRSALEKGTLQDVSGKVAKYLLIIIVGLTLPVAFYSQHIVAVFGRQFEESSLPLSILMGALALYIYRQQFSYLLNVLRKQKQILFLDLMVLTVNLAANLLLIPVIGLIGAAISMVVSEAFGFLAGYMAVRKQVSAAAVYRDLLLTSLGAVAFAGCLLATNLYFPLERPGILLAAVLANILFFIGFLVVTGVLTKKEMQIVLGMGRAEELTK